MSASTYVGRIGALAAALGVGAALFSGPGIAWADTTPSDTPGSSAPEAPAGAQADTPTAGPTRGHTARSARTPHTAQSSTAGQSAPETSTPDVPAAIERDLTSSRAGDSAQSAPQQKPDVGPAPAAAVKANDNSPAVKPAAADPVVDTPAASPAAATEPAVPTPAPAATQTVTSLLETAQPAVAPKLSVTSKAVAPTITLPAALTNVANHITTVINSVVSQLVSTFSGHSPFVPQANSPLNWLVLAASRRQPLAAATTASAVSTPATPTLVLNGYNVVADSIEIIDAFTGRWAYWPGQPNMQQGRQDFKLVDPNTGAEVGGFSALVTTGDPTSLGANYVEMLVTSNDGTNVGTGAGQTPPVGSVISDFTLGLVGVSYSSMPTPAGDKVSVTLKTPFISIPLPLTFDASKGIVDHTFDNRPMDITGGFNIAPADPNAEKLTGAIGLLPLFNSLQGDQKFGVYDSTGKKVGTFDGLFTTTSDTLGISTQAILVTGNDGIDVGTNPGQTPPVGTVYNVAYFFSDKTWLLYSSMPQASGDVITLKFGTPQGVTDLTSLGLPNWLFPQTTFNASREPAMRSMVAPGGQKFVASSDVIPSGINGLPPRDVQIQGYQQFDVYDFLGRKIGTIDADVENQWDSSTGVHSKSILVTKVTSGDVGTTPLNVPPVGTVMNFIDFSGGFGIADSVIPQKGTNLNSFQFVTPFGNIPLLPSISLATHPEVEYTNPF
ncbi:MAG: hypothetical protein U0R66_07010 [Mycobacterium sp.]